MLGSTGFFFIILMTPLATYGARGSGSKSKDKVIRQPDIQNAYVRERLGLEPLPWSEEEDDDESTPTPMVTTTQTPIVRQPSIVDPYIREGLGLESNPWPEGKQEGDSTVAPLATSTQTPVVIQPDVADPFARKRIDLPEILPAEEGPEEVSAPEVTLTVSSSTAADTTTEAAEHSVLETSTWEQSSSHPTTTADHGGPATPSDVTEAPSLSARYHPARDVGTEPGADQSGEASTTSVPALAAATSNDSASAKTAPTAVPTNATLTNGKTSSNKETNSDRPQLLHHVQWIYVGAGFATFGGGAIVWYKMSSRRRRARALQISAPYAVTYNARTGTRPRGERPADAVPNPDIPLMDFSDIVHEISRAYGSQSQFVPAV